MCSACGFPAAPGHWTDAGATDGPSRIRLRMIRLASVNRLLAPWGLRAHDDGATPGFQLASPTGRVELVPDLAALWAMAATMAGEVLDPLSDRALAEEPGTRPAIMADRGIAAAPSNASPKELVSRGGSGRLVPAGRREGDV